MMPVPAPRLVAWGTAASVASLAVLAFPDAWLVLVALDLVLAGAALLDVWLTPGPSSLKVRRLVPDPLAVLREETVALRLSNESGASLSVRVRDGVPPSFRPSAAELSGIVPAQGELRLEYGVKPSARGLHAWGPLHLWFRSLLGLWEKRLVLPTGEQSRVYPNLTLLQQYHVLARSNHLAALGIRRVRQRGSAREFESLRDYVSGDDVRLLDWKATARRARLI